MTDPTPCAGVQERLTDALLERREPGAPDLVHAERCVACAAHRDDLLAIRAGLDAQPAPEVPPRVLAAARRRAAEELARIRVPARAPLPRGYGRELARLLGPALVALPVVLLWNWAILVYGGGLLADRIPAALTTALGAAYALAAGGTLALVFGSLPFVAHGQVRQRLQEVTP